MKSFLGNFYRHLAIFSGHTGGDLIKSCPCSHHVEEIEGQPGGEVGDGDRDQHVVVLPAKIKTFSSFNTPHLCIHVYILIYTSKYLNPEHYFIIPYPKYGYLPVLI